MRRKRGMGLEIIVVILFAFIAVGVFALVSSIRSETVMVLSAGEPAAAAPSPEMQGMTEMAAPEIITELAAEPVTASAFAHSPYYEPGLPPLFNRYNPIPDDWEPDLVPIGDGRQLNRRAALALESMIRAASNDGISLTVLSAYRSDAQQTINFNAGVAARMEQGMSAEEAHIQTARWIALPGTSEHTAGVAVDFNWVDVRFNQTPEFAWLVNNAANFGFILRYPYGTEHITHIAYEPWHFRYVGVNHAKSMAELGIATLEEYLALFR